MLYDSVDFDLISDSDREMLTDNRMAIKNCILTEATVNEYLGEEIKDYQKANLKPDQIYKVYRPLEEIQKVLAQYNGLDLIDDHHTMNGLKDNRKHAVGATGESAIIDGYKVKNTVFITDKKALKDIEMATKSRGQFGKRCLSCSYDYTPVFEKGVFNNMAYDLKIKDLKLDHLALVEKGRVRSAMLSDSDKTFKKGNYMKELIKSTLKGIFGINAINDSQVEQVMLLNDKGGTSYSHKGTSHIGGINTEGKYMKEMGNSKRRVMKDEECDMDDEEMSREELMHMNKMKQNKNYHHADDEKDEEEMDDKRYFRRKNKKSNDEEEEKEYNKKDKKSDDRKMMRNRADDEHEYEKEHTNDKRKRYNDEEEEYEKKEKKSDDKKYKKSDDEYYNEYGRGYKANRRVVDKKAIKDAVNEEIRETRNIQNLCAKVRGHTLSDSALELDKEDLLNDTLQKLGYNVEYSPYDVQKIMIETLAHASFRTQNNNNKYYGNMNDSQNNSNKFVYTVENIKKLGGN
jgi:hypothetical protein